MVIFWYNETPGNMAPLTRTKEVIKKLPASKPHLEFIAAILTIPVLITVLVLNLANINNAKKQTPTPTPSPTITTERIFRTIEAVTTPNPTANPISCIKGIGPIDVTYPQEGQTVSDNPLCIGITYTQGNYCSSVWSYKINGANFSDYSNNSVCLYNIPQGNNTFVLQVKSQVNSDQKTIERHFIYNGNTPTPVATSSASQQ